MALKTMIKRIVSAHEKYEAELNKVGAKVAKGLAKEIGELLPAGWVFCWTQGTPSFNDGDPCTFSVHTPQLKTLSAIGDEDEDAEEDDFDDDFDDEVDTEDGEDDEDDDDTEPEDDGEPVDAEDDDSEEESEEVEDDGVSEMDLGTALKKYGAKTKRRYYTSNDYSRPVVGEKDRWGAQKYEQKREAYLEHGFPVVEGYTKAKLKQLVKLWDSLPEDLLKRAFGDGASVTIWPNGKFTNDEYYDE